MLKTDFLGLNYHPNPATNTDEVDAEKYFNENYFTIDANAKSVNEQLNKQISKVKQLQTENSELSNNMPWNATSGKSLHITDSAKYSKNKLEISGNLKQETRSGKNIVDFGNLESNKTSLKISFVNDVLVASQSGAGAYVGGSYDITSKIKNNPSKTLKFVFESLDTSGHTSTNGIIIQIEIANNDNKKTYFGMLKKNNKITNYSIPSDTSNIKQALFCIYTNNSTDAIETSVVKITKPMLIFSDVTDETYEQYGAMPSTEFPSMPVVCTGVQKIRQFEDNWFNKNNISKINAVVDTSSIAANSSGKTFYIKIEPDTYTVSRKVIGARFVVGTTANIPKIGETIIDRIVNNSGSSITLTTSKNANYLVVYYLYNSSENEQEILDSIQIERGPKATKCKSYIEEINTLDLKNTELCAIKDTNGNVVAQDRAVYRNGKWQWEKKIKKFALKGTENFGKSSNTANISYYLNSTEINNIDINTIPNAQTNRDFVIEATCNYFRPVSLNTLFSNTEGFTIDIADAKRIELRLGFKLDTEITTVALLKEWLAQKYAEGNPVTIYFILATPVYEDCTAEQSAILDKLYNNFTLQKGTNNIIVETDNGVGVNMQLDYMQDLQTKLNLLEAMCVSNASQEV